MKQSSGRFYAAIYNRATHDVLKISAATVQRLGLCRSGIVEPLRSLTSCLDRCSLPCFARRVTTTFVKISPWNEPPIVEWSRLLLDSYRHWTGKHLIEHTPSAKQQARMLFEASIIVVSHGVEQDPILNYGNQTALDLWELSWDQFIKTPSRLTAEADDRAEREKMLERAKLNGYFDGYRGVRISSTGRRFLVERALIWTVIDLAETPIGQAATFSRWSNLS